MPVEPIRINEFTGRRFTFFAGPDGSPLERYESDPATAPVTPPPGATAT